MPRKRLCGKAVYSMALDTPDITLDNLAPAQREIAEVVGLEPYLALARLINGDSIYIPKYDSLYTDAQRIQRDEDIISKFDGYNFEDLAREYNLCKRTLYNIIPGSVRSNKRNGPIDGQLSFEEDFELDS